MFAGRKRMPYGPRSARGHPGRANRYNRYRRGQSAARRKTVARSRNKAVRRVYRRAATVPRTKVGANKGAIAVLASQVKALQASQIGAYQKAYQYCALVGGAVAWNTRQPLCFAMNNFLPEAPLYIGKAERGTAGVQQGFIPGFVQIRHWENCAPNSTFQNYDYWYGANDDVASAEQYMPLSTQITINFQAPALEPGHEIWCRVDIVKPTKNLLHSTVHKLHLPNNIQALGYLASSDMQLRNRLNPTYFTIYETKWVRLYNDNVHSKNVEQWCKFSRRFPQKVLKLDSHQTVQTETGEEYTTTFLTQVSPNDIYWMILSTSNDGGDDDLNHVQVEMSRVIHWRDQHGVDT